MSVIAEEIVILVKAETDKAIADLKRTETQTDKTSTAFSTMGKLLAGGAIIAGIKKLADASIQLYNEFGDAELSAIKLGAAVKNAGQLSSGAESRLSDLAQELQNISIFEGDATTAIIANLAAMGRSEDQINSIIEAAADLASATGQDLESAVSQLNATLNGTAGILGRQNGAVRALTKEELIAGRGIEVVAAQYKGFSQQVGDSAAGAVLKFKNQMGDLKENMGEQVSIFMKPAIEAFTKLLQKANESAAGIKAFQAALAGEKVEGSAIDKALVNATKQLEAIDVLIKANKANTGDFAIAQAKNLAAEREKILVAMRALVQAQKDELRNAKDLAGQKKVSATTEEELVSKVKEKTAAEKEAYEAAQIHADTYEASLYQLQQWMPELEPIAESMAVIGDASEDISVNVSETDKALVMAQRETASIAEEVLKWKDSADGTEWIIRNIAVALAGATEEAKGLAEGIMLGYDAASGFLESYGDLQENQHDAEIARIQREIEARKEAGQDTTQLEQELQNKKNEFGKKAFDSDKANKIAGIAIDTAKAIMLAVSTIAPPWGEVAAVALGALGAGQAAMVAAQTYVPMAHGGEFTTTGPTHILAGEAGAERIRVEPLRGGGGTTGKTVIVNQNVAGSILTENYLTQKAMSAIAYANRGY
jgi:hypothetical protein